MQSGIVLNVFVHLLNLLLLMTRKAQPGALLCTYFWTPIMAIGIKLSHSLEKPKDYDPLIADILTFRP